MINIDLIPDKPIKVLISTKAMTITRIGEIILLPNEIDTDKPFDARPPWENLLVANDWEIKSGVFIREPPSKYTTIILTAQVWDIEQISRLTEQSLLISFIQQNVNNGLQAAICSQCYLVGTKISDNNINIAFRSKFCQMNYNR